MYARNVEDRAAPLTFGVSGKLIMNVLVMYDRETDSLWSQILGKAVAGELAGAELTPLPAQQTTWAHWRELHPDTVALDKGFAGGRDPYTSYYQGGQAGVLGETRSDDRLPAKELGLGLVVDGQAAYFPFSRLAEGAVANADVAGHKVLVLYQPEAQTASAFRAVAAGRSLAFQPDRRDGGALTVVDAETGSRWNADGTAFEGPLAGHTLERLPATTSFWFGWKDWHPDTYLYGFDEIP